MQLKIILDKELKMFCKTRYSLVHRGGEYRLRRKRWWGWQWYHEPETEIYSSRFYEIAKNMLDSVNFEIERKENFIRDKKWKEVWEEVPLDRCPPTPPYKQPLSSESAKKILNARTIYTKLKR